MAFSEETKKEVRQKAAYQCCRCRNFGPEVHHILPQKDGGDDSVDNAAPLCPNCHADFGDNPQKRKIIGEMRDWWYETVKKMYGKDATENMELIKKIDKQITDMRENHSQDVSELKKLLKEFSNKSIEKVTPENASVMASSVVNATRLADNLHANVHCKNCGTRIGLLVGSNVCPTCKTPIN